MKQYTTGHDDSGSRSEGPLSSVDRPRLVVIDNLELSTRLDPYLSLRALATYSGCSIRWFRDRLVDASHPLPCYRVEGKMLVRRSDFDDWIAGSAIRVDPKSSDWWRRYCASFSVVDPRSMP